MLVVPVLAEDAKTGSVPSSRAIERDTAIEASAPSIRGATAPLTELTATALDTLPAVPTTINNRQKRASPQVLPAQPQTVAAPESDLHGSSGRSSALKQSAERSNGGAKDASNDVQAVDEQESIEAIAEKAEADIDRAEQTAKAADNLGSADGNMSEAAVSASSSSQSSAEPQKQTRSLSSGRQSKDNASTIDASSAPAPTGPALKPSPYRGRMLSQGSPPLPPLQALPQTVLAEIVEPDDGEAKVEPGELLLLSASMAEARQSETQLRGYRLRIKSRQHLTQFGWVLSVYRMPEGADTLAMVRQLQVDFPQWLLDGNQRYFTLAEAVVTGVNDAKTGLAGTQGGGKIVSPRKHYGRRLLGWPDVSAASCTDSASLKVGMIDTPVNSQHPALVGQSIHLEPFASGTPASPLHGTAVASLLVGNGQAEHLGLLPNASLYAASVFRQRGDKTDTTTSSLLQALDWLLSQKVTVINLSLGGEYNLMFERALVRVLEKNVALVAAAGNLGPEGVPQYPAAQAGVIAVTAVDAAGRLYRQANTGNHIDFAAPGVDVWAADADSGGRYQSGTSFAAPFVSAIMAINGSGSEDTLQRLQQKALDKGPEGKDELFGWGLISVPWLCEL